MSARILRRFTRPFGAAPGFSLVEIMVALVVAGIMLSFTLPEVARSARLHKLRTAATLFQTTLAKARSEAITKGVTVRVDYWAEGGFYIIREDQDGDGYFDTYTGWGWIPRGIQVSGLDFGGNTWVSFGPNGVPSSSGSILVSTSTGVRREIRLAPGSGAATICVPDPEGQLTRS